MIKKFIYLLAALGVLEAVTTFAQEGAAKAAEGALLLNKKTYPLTHAVAYESSNAAEEAITVVLSAQAMPNEKLKRALSTEKAGGFAEFPQPYLKLVFKKTGELTYWNALGGGTTVAGSSDGTGELRVEDGHATGKANSAVDASALIPKGFDVRFNVALLKAGDELPPSAPKKPGPAANVKPTVTGTFKGNGQDGKLAYVSARWSEPFDGKTGITLLLTEKDHSKEKKPDTDAMFGKFGNALIISLHEDGSIYSCQVVHSALKNKGLSSSGLLEAPQFNYADGKVEGELTTNGDVDTFGEKWEVNLKFVAPLGEIPKEYLVAESTKSDNPAAINNADVGDESATKSTKKATQPSAAAFKAKDLTLTKDAADVDYKALVGQIAFKSKSNVKTVCAELASSLKKQGWSNSGSDLITPKSSILKRKLGAAKLTIFVKPEPSGGSEVKMMTEGLSWDGE